MAAMVKAMVATRGLVCCAPNAANSTKPFFCTCQCKTNAFMNEHVLRALAHALLAPSYKRDKILYNPTPRASVQACEQEIFETHLKLLYEYKSTFRAWKEKSSKVGQDRERVFRLKVLHDDKVGASGPLDRLRIEWHRGDTECMGGIYLYTFEALMHDNTKEIKEQVEKKGETITINGFNDWEMKSPRQIVLSRFTRTTIEQPKIIPHENTSTQTENAYALLILALETRPIPLSMQFIELDIVLTLCNYVSSYGTEKGSSKSFVEIVKDEGFLEADVDVDGNVSDRVSTNDVHWMYWKMLLPDYEDGAIKEVHAPPNAETLELDAEQLGMGITSQLKFDQDDVQRFYQMDSKERVELSNSARDRLNSIIRSNHPLRFGPNPEALISFQITRHATSCNNVRSLIEKDVDPSITVAGIRDAEKLAMNERDRFSADVDAFIHTSCLIRTWQTAVVLYGHGRETLNLIVAPFLKEHLPLTGVTRGNYPIGIHPPDSVTPETCFESPPCKCATTQMHKMLCFLDQLKTNLAQPKNFENLRKVCIKIGGEEHTFSKSSEGRWKWMTMSDDDIIYNREYLDNGDVKKWLNWIRESQDIIEEGQRIHCVTHSKVMKMFVENVLSSQDSYMQAKRMAYSPKNCWSILGYTDITNNPHIEDMLDGTPKNNMRDDRDLCGYG